MRNKIRYIEQNKERYKYNFIGLFGIAFNVREFNANMHSFVRNL